MDSPHFAPIYSTFQGAICTASWAAHHQSKSPVWFRSVECWGDQAEYKNWKERTGREKRKEERKRKTKKKKEKKTGWYRCVLINLDIFWIFCNVVHHYPSRFIFSQVWVVGSLKKELESDRSLPSWCLLSIDSPCPVMRHLLDHCHFIS